VRERIAVLIQEALQEGEGVVNGIRIWSRVPPSTKAINEIKRYGDDSVPALTRYLGSDNEHERALAVEFLGLLGGRRIVTPLQKVIRYDASRRIRIQALLWISQAPWELASPVIREAMETDLDPSVREAAKNILVEHAPE
jgi:HEAT repeat protein